MIDTPSVESVPPAKHPANFLHGALFIMRTTRLSTILISLAVLMPGSVGAAATYYVANQGADTNDGLSPETAWATIEHVNAAPIVPGDRVLFRRNDVWRTHLHSLVPNSGNESGWITFGAYGDGAKPLLLGSMPKNDPNDWKDEGGGIWSTGGFPADVGNIIFGDDEVCGAKVWCDADLNQERDYWYDATHHVVRLRLGENPAKRHSRIECAIYRHIIDENARSYVIYENLMLKYGAAHGIGGGNTHHIIVRDCDFGFIGGADQFADERRVRFGNGVEFWAAAHDIVVERCRLWEIYDAALTNQSLGPKTPQYNIIYRNNVIWNSEYSFEYWNRPQASETHDVYFVNNTCLNAGHGWGHSQRPDPSGCHLKFYSSEAPAVNIVIRNNIFDGATGPAFYAPQWSKSQIDAMVMDHNCWRQDNGVMIQLPGVAYSMADFSKYQSEWAKEPHSICGPAGFVNANLLDLHLASDSPCIDAGGNESIERDFDGTSIPQGNAPDIGAYEAVAK